MIRIKVSEFKLSPGKIHLVKSPNLFTSVCITFTAIFNVTSLKCVQHKTNPVKIIKCMTKKVVDPPIHALSYLNQCDLMNSLCHK
jgi:hypothetical protein